LAIYRLGLSEVDECRFDDSDIILLVKKDRGVWTVRFHRKGVCMVPRAPDEIGLQTVAVADA